MGPALLAAALACSGCAALGGRLRPAVAASAPAQGAQFVVWWNGLHDDLLARLIANGLADDRRLTCQALALTRPDNRGVLVPRSGGGRGLFAQRDRGARRQAFVFAYHEAQSQAVMAIGLAYVEARLARDRLALREDIMAGLRDNREIAGFRRDAGLVAGLDVGLSGLIVDLDASGIDAARADFAGAVDRLAALSRFAPAQVQEWLMAQDRLAPYDAGGAIDPEAAILHRADLLALQQSAAAKAGPDEPYRAGLAQARERLIAAGGTLDAARKRVDEQARIVASTAQAVADARLNYRLGKQGMATLYVAEAAALAAREGLALATVAFDKAAIALWTAQGRGWSLADDVPPLPGKGSTACE